MLLARQCIPGCDPVRPPLPCPPPNTDSGQCRGRPRTLLAPVAGRHRCARPDYVQATVGHPWHSSAMGSTPAADYEPLLSFPHSTKRALTPDDESGGHRSFDPIEDTGGPRWLSAATVPFLRWPFPDRTGSGAGVSRRPPHEVEAWDWSSFWLAITPGPPSGTMAGDYQSHHALSHTSG